MLQHERQIHNFLFLFKFKQTNIGNKQPVSRGALQTYMRTKRAPRLKTTICGLHKTLPHVGFEPSKFGEKRQNATLDKLRTTLQ